MNFIKQITALGKVVHPLRRMQVKIISLLSLGHSPAVHNVGVHYFAGRGVELDMKKAAKYFAQAAESGFELSLVREAFPVLLFRPRGEL